MKKIWGYISAMLAGVILGMILFYELVKNNISNISIKKQVQKNRKSPNNVQEHNAEIKEGKKKRKIFNLKRRKNDTNIN